MMDGALRSMMKITCVRVSKVLEERIVMVSYEKKGYNSQRNVRLSDLMKFIDVSPWKNSQLKPFNP